ncbi:condensation domain-containing protein [Saccharopolyspora rosea]|uniref:Condensation domain-containing protein n=1 Tax=Saccharopolyspora rosea TaxID=524884 RepID=A0ABW3FUX0_9PSEU
MRITELAEYPVRPGRVREWRPGEPETATPDATPPSYNQEWHFRRIETLRARGIRTPAWLGVGFEIGGELHVEAFGAALTAWNRRHETLRSGFRTGGRDLDRFTVAPSPVVGTVLAELTDTDDVTAFLRERLDRGTDGTRWPNHVVETVERPGSTTVLVAFDHSNVDGYSLLATPHELRELYEAAVDGREPDRTEVGSYLRFSRGERSAAESIGRDHPAVVEWERFLADCGGQLPRFPLDLGVPDGDLAPHAAHEERLFDAFDAAAFEEVCRAGRGSALAGVLAATAITSCRLRGESVYRTVAPFQTRTGPEWLGSMGWYVGTGPVRIDLAGAADFADVLPRAQRAARTAMRVARTPFVRVCELLGADMRLHSPDAFSFVSYLDMRDIPGADRWADWNARALVRMSYGDKASLWVNRTHEGMDLVVRYPDTATARRNIASFVDELRSVLRTAARGGATHPLHPETAR